jgi:hypothetical protein
MVGSGSLGNQTMQDVESLPQSSNVTTASGNGQTGHNGASPLLERSMILSSFFLLLASGLALLG